MEQLIYRELRWFLSGAAPQTVVDWFDALPGDYKEEAFPRQDVYLVVPGRDDLGAKVREGRFELKIRESRDDSPCRVADDAAGFVEDWSKLTWDYKSAIGDLTTPFESGRRVRTIKSRVRRKYDGAIEPVDVSKKLDAAFLIELTEVHTQALDPKGTRTKPVRHWTVACEAIAPRERVHEMFEKGIRKLLSHYSKPALIPDDSYGYPRYVIDVFDAT